MEYVGIRAICSFWKRDGKKLPRMICFDEAAASIQKLRSLAPKGTAGMSANPSRQTARPIARTCGCRLRRLRSWMFRPPGAVNAEATRVQGQFVLRCDENSTA